MRKVRDASYVSRCECHSRVARSIINSPARTVDRHSFGMQTVLMQLSIRIHIFSGLRYHAVVRDTCCLFTRRRCLLFRRLFLFVPSIPTSRIRERRPSSHSLSFAFIKYKQFHTFCPTPERPAGHIFTTQHSGFCQVFSAPASRAILPIVPS